MEKTAPIYVVAHVMAKAGKADLLREALETLVLFAKSEPGFIRYDLHEQSDIPGSFVFYEIWASQAALNAHSSTKEMQAHRDLTKEWVESSSVEIYRLIDA